MASGQTGTFRRRIEITTREMPDGNSQARCVVEDDFHHFRVVVSAREGRVVAISNDALRSPNTLCDAAGGRLHELIGTALDPSCAAVQTATDQFQQCTHQFDLAGLGVAALALGRPRRVYQATIPDRAEDGRTIAALDVDGMEALRWEVNEMTVEAPEPYAGHSLGAGFTRFTRSLPCDEAEAALVLRRALFVSQGRKYDTEFLERSGPVGGCWAWQPERMDTLRRLPENRISFSDRAEALLVGDDDWLAFRV